MDLDEELLQEMLDLTTRVTSEYAAVQRWDKADLWCDLSHQVADRLTGRGSHR